MWWLDQKKVNKALGKIDANFTELPVKSFTITIEYIQICGEITIPAGQAVESHLFSQIIKTSDSERKQLPLNV